MTLLNSISLFKYTLASLLEIVNLYLFAFVYKLCLYCSREAEPYDHLADPCTVPDVGDIKKSKKKKKGKEKETKSSSNGDSTEPDNSAQDEPKMNTAQNLLDQEMVDNVDKEAVDDGKKDGEDRENITIETKLKTDNVVADIQTHR